MTGSCSTSRWKSCPPAASWSRKRFTSCSDQFLSAGSRILVAYRPYPVRLERCSHRAGSGGEAHRRALADEPVEPGEGESADDAPVGLVRRVEVFDLGDRRPPALASQAADQLDVGEVAGGERVEFVAPEQTEALHG